MRRVIRRYRSVLGSAPPESWCPLVQDSEIETDEAFVVELSDETNSIETDVYRRIVVMIRDDDPQRR